MIRAGCEHQETFEVANEIHQRASLRPPVGLFDDQFVLDDMVRGCCGGENRGHLLHVVARHLTRDMNSARRLSYFQHPQTGIPAGSQAVFDVRRQRDNAVAIGRRRADHEEHPCRQSKGDGTKSSADLELQKEYHEEFLEIPSIDPATDLEVKCS
jgi:hypothetical protein